MSYLTASSVGYESNVGLTGRGPGVRRTASLSEALGRVFALLLLASRRHPFSSAVVPSSIYKASDIAPLCAFFLQSHLSSSSPTTVRDPRDYMGPTQIVQDNLPILKLAH